MSSYIDIERYLPHRPPMLMVDKILTIDAEHVETFFNILPNNIFLENGLLAETGLVENAAQTCSSILGKGYFIDDNDEEIPGVDIVGYISAIKTLKIHQLPAAGSTIFTRALLKSKFVTEQYSMCTLGFEVRCEGVLLSEGEMNLFISDRAAATA